MGAELHRQVTGMRFGVRRSTRRGKIGAVIDLTARLEELDDVNLIVRSLW